MKFGKYKDKKIVDVPDDYFEFMIKRGEEGNPIIYKSENWSILSGEILADRYSVSAPNGIVPSPARLPESDLQILQSEPYPAAEITLSPEAIDQASFHLLREFITREDKSLGFYSWLQQRIALASAKLTPVTKTPYAVGDLFYYFHEGIRIYMKELPKYAGLLVVDLLEGNSNPIQDAVPDEEIGLPFDEI